MIAGDAVRHGGGLVFGTLLAPDLRDPVDAEDSGMALEQAAAERLVLTTGDVLVCRFEQGA